MIDVVITILFIQRKQPNYYHLHTLQIVAITQLVGFNRKMIVYINANLVLQKKNVQQMEVQFMNMHLHQSMNEVYSLVTDQDHIYGRNA